MGRLWAYLDDFGAAHRPPQPSRKKSCLWRVGGRVPGGTLELWGGRMHSPKRLLSSVCEAAAFRRISIFIKTPPNENGAAGTPRPRASIGHSNGFGRSHNTAEGHQHTGQEPTAAGGAAHGARAHYRGAHNTTGGPQGGTTPRGRGAPAHRDREGPPPANSL